eukprot:365429-Chlamydomonas_euryale.AAC.9
MAVMGRTPSGRGFTRVLLLALVAALVVGVALPSANASGTTATDGTVSAQSSTTHPSERTPKDVRPIARSTVIGDTPWPRQAAACWHRCAGCDDATREPPVRGGKPALMLLLGCVESRWPPFPRRGCLMECGFRFCVACS